MIRKSPKMATILIIAKLDFILTAIAYKNIGILTTLNGPYFLLPW
jgi:hypothetical protein